MKADNQDNSEPREERSVWGILDDARCALDNELRPAIFALRLIANQDQIDEVDRINRSLLMLCDVMGDAEVRILASVDKAQDAVTKLQDLARRMQAEFPTNAEGGQ